MVAPLVGALLEVSLMRRIANQPLEIGLTVTVALLTPGIAISTAVWDPAETRFVPQFFPGNNVTIGSVVLSAHQLLIVAAAVLAAATLSVFFRYTRTGIATRAVVDDRELTSLAGANPGRLAQLGWAMGCSLAAISGILIVSLNSLNATTLTLLVINGYAAAMVGRLSSLPLTFVGALVLGLTQSCAVFYFPAGQIWTYIGQVIPMLFLLGAMLVFPQPRLALTKRAKAPSMRQVGWTTMAGGVLALLVAVVIGVTMLSDSGLSYASRGVAIAIVLLSLVLVTGYGGQVSLCQFAFAGLGAIAMSKVGGESGSLLGVVAAAVLAGIVGALVALPTLRLRGLYLALATMAFAYGMDSAVFNNARVFGISASLPVARPNIPGLSLDDDGTYLVLLCVVFALAAIGLLAMRRSRYGRRLIAVSDSPSASLTLGVDLIRVKLVTFTAAAALAGIGGALYGGAQGAVAPADFSFLISLTALLLAVVFGIKSTAGILIAGICWALGPPMQQHLTEPRSLLGLMIGLAAIGVAQNPEGTFGGVNPLRQWRETRAVGSARGSLGSLRSGGSRPEQSGPPGRGTGAECTADVSLSPVREEVGHVAD